MKSPVLRTCALTREKLEKKELFRIVREPNGIVSIDDNYKKNGRGSYLKKDIEVINKAKKLKLLDKNLNVIVDEKIYDELVKRL